MMDNLTPPGFEDLTSRIQWINHRSVRILRQDYTNLAEPQIISLMEVTRQKLIAVTTPNSVRELLLISNIKVSRKLLDLAIKLSGECDHNVMRTSVVGLTGAKLLIVKMYNRFAGSPMVPFPTEGEALAWLVSP